MGKNKYIYREDGEARKYIKPAIFGFVVLLIVVFIILLTKSCSSIDLTLNSLTVTGGKLSPEFNAEKVDYAITTESALLYIQCSSANKDAKINGCGKIDLTGKNGETYKHKIEVSQGDEVKEYVLSIVVPNEFSIDIESLIVSPEDWTKDSVKIQIVPKENIYLSEEPYSFDDGETWQKEESMEFSENEYVEVRIKDIYNNISPKLEHEIKNIDNEAPKILLKANGGKFEITDGDTTKIDVVITVDETASGVATLKYGWSYSNEEKPKEFINFVDGDTISSDKGTGIYYLWIYAEDKVGNKNEYFVSSSYTVSKNGSTAPTEYTITYDANGGTGTPSPQTKVRDTSLQLTKSVPTRTGYSFKGWSLNASDSSIAYMPGSSYVKNESAILYAVWEDNSRITIYYNSNGANISKSSDKILPGSTIILPTITRDGFEIIGWSTNKNDTSATYESGASTSFNSGVTLYAITKKNIIITFNKINGAKGIGGTSESIITKTCTILNSSSSCSISSPSIEVATEWVAVGWSLTNNSTQHDIRANVSFAATNSASYYTVTKFERSYVATFDKNTAAAIGDTKLYCTTPASYNGVVRNTSCVVIAPTISAISGKTVVGWSKDPNATTSSYPPGAQISISANTKYYAITK